MNKEEYAKALKSPKWKAKRKIILKRDNHKCTKCGCKTKLHVHHTYYLEGKMPWEVPDDCLLTLCKVCHDKEHEGKDIKSFVKKLPPKQTKEVKKKNTNKKKLKHNITKKADVELQKKYNEIKAKGKLPEPTYKPLENPPRKGIKQKKKKKR